MPSALISNASRILVPVEVEAIRSVIRKPSNVLLFDLLLYTGLRLSEVLQLAQSPDLFDNDRRIITIRSGKARASQITRNVKLCDKGVAAVKRYLERPKVPASPSSWQLNLIRWGGAAQLSSVPGHDPGGWNPYRLTVRTSRKTLESWLLAAYPDRATHIALSQGHTEVTALKFYLNIAFTREERDAIVREVAGLDW
ncbi:MAG: site-specific integrase [Methanospirillum sp.]